MPLLVANFNPNSALLLIFVFVFQPLAAKNGYAQNFISNNPLKSDSDLGNNTQRWLRDFSKSVQSVPCHSHNDYLRPHPLFSGLVAGCISTEADIWLTDDEQDLLVGHTKKDLKPANTLQTLYINPLLEILDDINGSEDRANASDGHQLSGVFRTQPESTLVLFIDIKGDSAKTWPLLKKQLEPLRKKQYLSRYKGSTNDSDSSGTVSHFLSGPVTVVGTGNILKNRKVNIGSDPQAWLEYHDIFLDAPLDQLTNPDTFWSDTYPDYKPTSDMSWSRAEFSAASISFGKAIGSVRTGFSAKQRSTMRSQLQAADDKNLTSRYWSLPSWPISHRDFVWKTLVEEGIGLLNADDVQSAARSGWNEAYKMESVWIITTSITVVCGAVLFAWLSYRTVRAENRA